MRHSPDPFLLILLVLALVAGNMVFAHANTPQGDSNKAYLPLTLANYPPPPVPKIENLLLGGRAVETISVPRGASFRLRIEAANIAPEHGDALEGTISVYFPGEGTIENVQVVTGNTSPELLLSQTTGEEGGTLSARKTNWTAGAHYALELEVAAPDTSAVKMLVKLVMTSYYTRRVDPVSSSRLDPEGDPIFVRTATVLPLSGAIGRVNYYRSLAGLSRVTAYAPWAIACQAHAAYLAENNVLTHSEDPANPWYTPEGAAAAQSSSLALFQLPLDDEYTPVDLWMSSAFHAVGLLEPRWSETNFGSYTGSGRAAACLDVTRGIDFLTPADYPVYWPPSEGETPVVFYGGQATPDPLSACPGYTAPSGPPILLLTGDGSGVPIVTAHSLTINGQPAEHCTFTEITYTNPDPAQQNAGRNILGARDAVVVIPRQPFPLAATGTVSITVSGWAYTWSFRVAPGTLSPQAGSVAPGGLP